MKKPNFNTWSFQIFLLGLFLAGWITVSYVLTGGLPAASTLPLLAYSAVCLGGALVAIRLYQKKYRDVRMFDPQRKIFNERFLLMSLHMEYSRSRRHDFPMSLAVFSYDIEGLAGMNGTAEKLMHTVDNTVLESIRTSDVFSELGEGRYALLLPNSNTDGAQVVANRVVNRLNKELKKLKLGARVTPAFGICGLGCENISAPEDLVAGALQAHEEATRSLRNRINVCGVQCAA